jgi:DNA invertase Pin-like site-specific DNA recombinase
MASNGSFSWRPALAQLWMAVLSRKADALFVWKFDRFARSTKQLIDALEEFRHLGVAFIWRRTLGTCERRCPPSPGHALRRKPNV